MSNSFERAAVYREIVDDSLASGLLDEDELLELRDMLARVERRVVMKLSEAAE
jgi:hypothetical protein